MYPILRPALNRWMDAAALKMAIRKQKSKYTRKKGKRKP